MSEFSKSIGTTSWQHPENDNIVIETKAYLSIRTMMSESSYNNEDIHKYTVDSHRYSLINEVFAEFVKELGEIKRMVQMNVEREEINQRLNNVIYRMMKDERDEDTKNSNTASNGIYYSW